MKKLVAAFLVSISSLSAFAGYECKMALAHSEDLMQTIAEKTISIQTNNMELRNHGVLLVESEKKKKKVSLTVNAAMSGWRGEEDATIVIMRKVEKSGKTKGLEAISEKIMVKGEEPVRAWFDEYKLEVACRVTE